MINKFGKLVTKFKTFPDVIVNDAKNRVYNASGVLQSENGSVSPNTVDHRVETITYTTRTKSNPLASNRCVHVRTRDWYSGNPQNSQRIMNLQAGKEGWYTEYYDGHSHAIAAHAGAVSAANTAFAVTRGAAVLGAGGQGYINSAAEALRPDLTTVSVPNFLADIEDVKSLYKLWKLSASFEKNVAGLYLNYKFGIKPTIGDVSAIVEVLTGMRAKLKAFEQSLNVLFTGRKTVLSDTITKSGSFNYQSDSHQPCYWTASLTRKCTAHIKWRPQPLAVMGGMDKNLRALLDSLGFELNPRIIWDALPFTFVLDWFFGIGGWLDNFKIDALELPIAYVDSALHYKEVIKIESTLFLDKNSSISSMTQWPSMVTTSDYFERMPIYPDYLTLKGLGWRMPTTTQAVLLASLATVLSPEAPRKRGYYPGSLGSWG